MTEASHKRSARETAVLSKEFLDSIVKLSHEKKLQPELVVSLFGYYCRHLADLLVDSGQTRQEAVSAVLERFTHGLGLKTEFVDDQDKGTLQ
jgi:hypothetical protein